MRPAYKFLITCCLPGLLSQCQEDKPGFYRDAMHGHDVWRLPIIAPYELITADPSGNDRWNFQQSEFNGSFSPDSINLSGSYISFYERVGSYGFCDLKSKQIVRLNTFAEFKDAATARNFGFRLVHTESVYNCWRETGQLPWAQQILAAQGCSPLSKK